MPLPRSTSSLRSPGAPHHLRLIWTASACSLHQRLPECCGSAPRTPSLRSAHWRSNVDRHSPPAVSRSRLVRTERTARSAGRGLRGTIEHAPRGTRRLVSTTPPFSSPRLDSCSTSRTPHGAARSTPNGPRQPSGRADAVPQRERGSASSVSSPWCSMAAATTCRGTRPCCDSPSSTATAIEAASTSKCRRRATRVSLRP